MNAFIHSFIQYLLSTYYVPNTMLDPGGTVMSKVSMVPALMEF